MHDVHIAFIGGGNMARAMIAGLLRAGVPPRRISVGEPAAEARHALSHDFQVAVYADNASALEGARLAVLAVKPQEMQRVLQSLAAPLRSGAPLLLSIAAGLRTDSLSRWCPDLAVVRAMPNRPALLGAGAAALYAPPAVGVADRALAETVMRSCGHTCWVSDEDLLDVVTALSGSGPAYFMWLGEQMAAAAERLGLDARVARVLAAETLYGSGQLAHADHDLAAQRAAVTSKGGTTEAALSVLNTPASQALIDAALAAAARRSAELSVQLTGS
jgi:pyrroline-5-carboxylate reductase